MFISINGWLDEWLLYQHTVDSRSNQFYNVDVYGSDVPAPSEEAVSSRDHPTGGDQRASTEDVVADVHGCHPGVCPRQGGGATEDASPRWHQSLLMPRPTDRFLSRRGGVGFPRTRKFVEANYSLR